MLYNFIPFAFESHSVNRKLLLISLSNIFVAVCAHIFTELKLLDNFRIEFSC